jgi:uncharacterized protein (UPF0303 family)
MNSRNILQQEKELFFTFSKDDLLINLYVFGLNFYKIINLPIALQMQTRGWTIFHRSLPESSPENDLWISRKTRAVELRHHSTLFKRVNAEEPGVEWYKENKVSEENFASHGGGFPLTSIKNGYLGSMIISGISQIEEHLLCIEVLSKFIESQEKKNE